MALHVVSTLVGRLGDLLIQQASFLIGVNNQVNDLRHEFMWIQSFLEDADSRQDECSVVRTWVSEIRDAAYNIEDIIDTHILKSVDEDERRRRFLGSLKRYACICQKGANLYTIGKEVKEVKTRIQQIGQAMQSYGIKDGRSRGGDRRTLSPEERFQQLRRSSPQDDATRKDTIGLDKTIEKLVAELVHEDQDQCCFTITGMGGIGKTTLATKVYDCEKIKHHFECRAWAYISKDFNVRDIIKRLIKEVKSNLNIEELQVMELLSEEDLEEKLRELLKDSRYLVVLDDIWDLEAWESLKRALPYNKKGRVILTSRNARVAKESTIYQLRTLNEIDSWKLFVTKAFGNDDSPANLEASGKEMVDKCDGLPLAITVLAGLLKGKSPQGWFVVGDHIHQQLMKEQGKNNVEKILSLSYNDLPYQLKACYLYICLFPEDLEISAERLIQLWVAEGFIRCERDYETMEDVAVDYLNELIDRNMLQVVHQDEMGKVWSCRIHDLLRDIYISKGQEENFLDYSPHASSSSSSTMATTYKSRRYAIHSGIGRYDFFNHCSNSHLRTLLFFNHDRESLQQRQLEFISKMRLLRVLDLSFVDLQGMRLPDAFGKLIHLRYLRLFRTKGKLPLSMEGLQSLQTLNLLGSQCHWSDIAIDALSKLTQLRHLSFNIDYWDGLDRKVAFRFRIDSLTNLQSLCLVDAFVWKQNEITNLINLRDLEIRKIGASDMESVLSSVAKLKRIQSLELRLSIPNDLENQGYYALPSLLPLSHCHHLQALTLAGKIERLPEDPCHDFPPKLTELNLLYSRLGPDTMEILEKLPNMMSLCLYESSIMGKKIVCCAQGFPQLGFLHINGLDIEEWEVKEGALPKLNHLRIWDCRNLKKIPMGLRFVASLQVLDLRSMAMEFLDRFDRGEDAHEIGHIPSITLR